MIDAMQTAAYSVIRLVPDPTREEFVNVGIVAVTPNGAEVQMLGKPSQAVRALAPPQTRRSLAEIEPYLSTRLAEADDPLQRLQELMADGISGYYFSAVRRRVFDVRTMSLRALCANLFDEMISPRSWREPSAVRHASRFATDLRNQLAHAHLPADRVAVGLQLRIAEAHFDFPLAFVNGSLNLVQAIDFDVTKDTQRDNLNRAIAHIAEVDKLLAAQITWTNVVRSGEDSYSYEKRLHGFGKTLTSDHVSELVDTAAREASRPISEYFTNRGHTVYSRAGAVEVTVGAPRDLIDD